MSILLHTCCAPCLTYSYKEFKKAYDDVTPIWFNPNIHPFKEYEKRLESMKNFEEEIDTKIIFLDEYHLEGFLKEALEAENRCEICYERRFLRTAKIAKEKKIPRFSTTLTISPYQDHQLIKKVGKRVGRSKDVEFIYKDLRKGFSEHHNMANKLNLYKQGYCGCIFSERDRYYKK